MHFFHGEDEVVARVVAVVPVVVTGPYTMLTGKARYSLAFVPWVPRVAMKVTVADIVAIDSFVVRFVQLSVASSGGSLMPFVVSQWVLIVSVTY